MIFAPLSVQMAGTCRASLEIVADRPSLRVEPVDDDVLPSRGDRLPSDRLLDTSLDMSLLDETELLDLSETEP